MIELHHLQTPCDYTGEVFERVQFGLEVYIAYAIIFALVLTDLPVSAIALTEI